MKIAIACAALAAGYLLGLKYPARFNVRLDPKPWTATEFYETTVPSGWSISGDVDDGSYGKWRYYRGDFSDSQVAEEIPSVLKQRSPIITEVHVWAFLHQVEIAVKPDAEWRDVDGLIAEALAKLSAKSPRRIHTTNDADLTAAVDAWSKALGRKVAVPYISHGGCGLALFAIACADNSEYSITIADDQFYDMKTVYEHELGHLFGVQHIKGDPLMDSEYQGQSGITKAALEAAKHPKFEE